MSKLMAAYFKEKQELEFFDGEFWFFTYKFFPQIQDMYVEHLYLSPDKRGQDFADSIWETVSELALENGCKQVSCAVDISHIKPETSLKFLLKLGFRIHSMSNNLIHLYKIIKR